MNLQETLNHPMMQELVADFRSQDWSNKKFYADWLAQSHYYTSYSTRMLAYAAGWSDKTSKNYFKRSIIHISEEQGHDLIAVNDMKNLGEQLENFTELGVTRAMWESQFYKIQKDPSYLLGYILGLEAFAVKTFKEFHAVLKQYHPEESLRFVKVHADDDPDHVEDALEQISNCSEEQKAVIRTSYEHTLQLYRLMLKETAQRNH